MSNTQVVEVEGVAKCPFCEKELDKIEKIKPQWGQPAVYRCPYCQKLLHLGTDIA